MTKNIDIEGLRSIADNYDLFYIDLWGVVHNGITPVSYTHLTLPTNREV